MSRYDFPIHLHTFQDVCMRAGLLLLMGCLSMSLHAENDYYRKQIIKRINPIGDVRVLETEQAVDETPPEKPEEEAIEVPGAVIYEKYCSVCHRAGVAGAPKFREDADWKPRLAKQGIDGIIKTAMEGINAMPPKGTCAECTEQDIRETVEYMLPQ